MRRGLVVVVEDAGVRDSVVPHDAAYVSEVCFRGGGDHYAVVEEEDIVVLLFTYLAFDVCDGFCAEELMYAEDVEG